MTIVNKFSNLAPLLDYSSSVANVERGSSSKEKNGKIARGESKNVKGNNPGGERRDTDSTVSRKNSRKSQEKKDNSLVEKFFNRTIRFELVKELRTVVAKIVDKKTGKVIRQIPPEELVEVAKQISEDGRLLNKEA